MIHNEKKGENDMWKKGYVACVFAVALAITGVPFGEAAPFAQAAGSGKGKFVKVTDCYKRLNCDRRKNGLKPLKRDAWLEKKARIRAKELVRRFSHTRPNGRDGIDMIPLSKAAGENIGSGQETCAEVMRDWMRSKNHRINLRERAFKRTGTAGYRYRGVTYWVQLYSS